MCRISKVQKISKTPLIFQNAEHQTASKRYLVMINGEYRTFRYQSGKKWLRNPPCELRGAKIKQSQPGTRRSSLPPPKSEWFIQKWANAKKTFRRKESNGPSMALGARKVTPMVPTPTTLLVLNTGDVKCRFGIRK